MFALSCEVEDRRYKDVIVVKYTIDITLLIKAVVAKLHRSFVFCDYSHKNIHLHFFL